MKHKIIFNDLTVAPAVKAAAKDALKKVDVYAYGEFYNEQSDFAREFGVVSLSSIVKQVQSNPDAEQIIVHIHSAGGDVNEGFAIHDFLVNSGKKVTTVIEGLCASIATVVSLAGSVRQMTKNSDYFIHNPWGDPFNMSGYTADDYAKRAEEIRQAEDKLLDFYALKTGADRATLADYMKQQTTFNADKALELKFITEVLDGVNAHASLGPIKNVSKNQIPMTVKDKMLKALNALAAVIKGEGEPEIKSLDLTKEDGTAIKVETQNTEPAVGDAVTINNEPAPDGDHKLSNGDTLVVAGGKITEIKKAEPAPDDADAKAKKEADEKAAADLAAIQAAAAEKDKEIAALKAKVQEQEDAMVKVTETLAKMKSNYQPDDKRVDPIKSKTSPDVNTLVGERVQERKAKLQPQPAKK